jgi:hypothetical protein
LADPVADVRRIPEWRMQAEIISKFHKLEKAGWNFTCAGDMNAGKRTRREAGKAKVTDMTAGEPDIRCYLDNGRLGLIELKVEGNDLTAAQVARHARLAALGHAVATVVAKTVEAAVDACVAILAKWIREGEECCVDTSISK